MKMMNITDFINTYVSFMRLKEDPKQIDVQIINGVQKASEGDGED